MKKSKVYFLVYCFVMIFLLAIVNYKQVFAESISKQSINLVRNSTFNKEKNDKNNWEGNPLTNWKGSLISKSISHLFPNIRTLVEYDEKNNAESVDIKGIQFEESITLNSKKRWLLNSEYTYKIRDKVIASVEDGFITPRRMGRTELIVSSPGRKDKIVTLVVEKDNQTFLQLLKNGIRLF